MKQEDLFGKTVSERNEYIHDRWDFMVREIMRFSTKGKYTAPSGMEDCRIKYDLGTKCVLRDEMERYFTFFGKLSSDSGMPEHGELFEDVKRYYFVGRLWAGEKPERAIRSPRSPMPTSKMIYQGFQSPPPPKRSHYECPSESPQRHGVPQEYCSCDCCKRTFTNHSKLPILKRHGNGQLVFEDGRFYDGQFHNDLYHGNGIFCWPDGQRYSGEYRNGLKHGRGKYTHPNGQFHIG